ncbi:hypothetical protein EYC80_005704 [Monilinia laxa]|uniref:Uncharacterized protein n=1 Tax=Monilinia laxa TaxID=61186 RepID=A0A5N6KET3_MONLA|nr:hypothetical protein EYC80_005704 [Monilinia laxa]
MNLAHMRRYGIWRFYGCKILLHAHADRCIKIYKHVLFLCYFCLQALPFIAFISYGYSEKWPQQSKTFCNGIIPS